MRIIGGSARGRMLDAPEGLDTRPTLDRVRTTIFDILQFSVPGSRVLDLYAGSGAMAFEALSRGAKEAVLCDQNPKAQAVIEKNARALDFLDRMRLLKMPDTQALSVLRGQRFHLAFLDPPYQMDTTQVIQTLWAGGMLEKNGWLIVEYALHEPHVPERLVCFRERKFGDTRVRIYRIKEENEP